MSKIKRLLSIFAFCILTGCGGESSGPVVTIQEPVVVAPAPIASVPVVTVPEPVASAPVVVPAPIPEKPWKETYRESWTTTVFGGWTNPGGLSCPTMADPGPIDSSPGNVWGDWTAGGERLNGQFVFNSYQMSSGYAVHSKKTFSKLNDILLTSTLDLFKDDGAWFGLTLLNAEGDYREISLRWDVDRLGVFLYAPCFLEYLGEVKPGPRKLQLEYSVSKSKWIYRVDDVIFYEEPFMHLGAELNGDPRIGLYIVNVKAEARLISGGWVRGTLGPVTVHER